MPVLPTLPQEYLTTTYIPRTGATHTVNGGGNLQTALDNANPGDKIVIEAGATFEGSFTLPTKAPGDYIYIESSALASLPEGVRVTPYAANLLMPKIRNTNTDPTFLSAAGGTHHYRFCGLEITTTHDVTSSTVANLVLLQKPGGNTSLADCPTDIVFDRCYIHGTPTGNIRRGIKGDSIRTSVVDCYISDIHELGNGDTQAFCSTNGPGPFKLVNNYLEAAGENVMFGGEDPLITNLVCSDIEFRNNHCFKKPSWNIDDPTYAGIQWPVKNNFELKNAQRVLADGNLFENCWGGFSQIGFAIVFTVRNQDGGASWSIVQDVTFTNNTIKNSACGVNMHGEDNVFTSQQATRILIKNNFWKEIDTRLIQIQCTDLGPTHVTFDHNTFINTTDESGNWMVAGGTPAQTIDNFTCTNNIICKGYLFLGDGTSDGNDTLNTWFASEVFTHNVIIAGTAANFPGTVYTPANNDAVGFMDWPHGDLRLAPASSFKGLGQDGRDMGVEDFAVARRGRIGSLTRPPRR